MTISRGATLAARIAASVDAIRALRPAIEASPPLPADADVSHGEAAWGPREIVAHVVEATTYWGGELERVLQSDSGAAPRLGRTIDDGLRAAIVARDRMLPPAVLLDRLGREAPPLIARVGGLGDADLGRAVVHVAWGEVTVADVIERTLAGHFEGHLDQLRHAAGG